MPALLRDQFTADMKAAMKGGDKPRLATIRLIQAALKDKDIGDRDVKAGGSGTGLISDEDILAMLQKMVKQREESIAIYDANGRPELAAGERGEIAVIATYLPRPLGEAEMASAIDAAIAETGAASMKDMGKVVARLRADHAGRMDFGKASGLVKARLSGG